MFLQQLGRLIGRDFNEQIGRARSEFARQGRCARAQLRHQAIGSQRAHNHAALSHRNTCFFRIGPNGVVGAAQTNGGQGCVESVLVLGSLTAFAAHGTAGALFKVNANFAGLRLVFVVLVGTDDQLRRWAQSQKGVVNHAQMQLAVGQGLNVVAHVNRIACLNTSVGLALLREHHLAIDKSHMARHG